MNLLKNLTELDLAHNSIVEVPELPVNLKLLNLSHNGIYVMPSQVFAISTLESVDIGYNMISVWVPDDTDFSKCVIKTLDVSFNTKLLQPPVSLLKESSISKLQLTGCNVSKKELLDNMDTNGVSEY